MNNEQTKTPTPGEIWYDRFHDLWPTTPATWYYLPDEVKEIYEKCASAVISHVLQGAKYVLLPKGSILQEGDQLSQHGMEFAEIVPTLVGQKMPTHCHGIRLIPLPSSVRPEGKPEWPSTTHPASSGAAGADVLAVREPKFKVGDEVTVVPLGATGKVVEVKWASVGPIYHVDGVQGWHTEGEIEAFHLLPPSAEPVVEEKPLPCPWCIPGVDNCHHSQEEIRSLGGKMVSCVGPLNGVHTTDQDKISHLTSERDQLRKENEDLSLELANKESLWREAIEARNQMTRERNEESKRANRLTAENAALKEKWESDKAGSPGHRWRCLIDYITEISGCTVSSRPPEQHLKDYITRLRSQFRWTPISTPPRAKDGDAFGRIVGEEHDGGLIITRWDLWEQLGRKLVRWCSLPPSPETEEQAMRREFEKNAGLWGFDDFGRYENGNYKDPHLNFAWLAYQAAKQSTGGAA